MAFVLPNFNLVVNLFRGSVGGVFDVTGPPDNTFNGNLAHGRRTAEIFDAQHPASPVPVAFYQVMELLIPPLTDVLPWGYDNVARVRDLVEVPGGSGRFYWVLTVDDVGKGFSNEYRYCNLLPTHAITTTYLGATVTGSVNWPSPMP